MEIKRKYLERSTIGKFADKHGLVMVVTERNNPDIVNGKYFASFENAEVMESGMLKGAYGNGQTEESAIEHYAIEISGKRLALNAYTEGRRELNVPLFND